MVILRRVLGLALFMLAAALLARSLFEFVPGDKARMVLGETATEAEIAKWNHVHGYDKPLPARLWNYAAGLARGELGRCDSEGADRPVAEVMKARLPATMKLAGAAGLFASLAGLLAALLWARLPGGRLAALLDALSSLGLVLPTFVTGPLLIWLFAVALGWLPSGGAGGPAHYPLPCLALGAGFAAYLARFGATLLAAELSRDYCRAARARGLSQSATLFKHALPNAAIPLLTAVTLQVAGLLGGAVLTEVIFRWPGIGELTVHAVQRHDLDLVAAIVMWGVLVYNALVGLADALILMIDPQAREAG